METGAIIFLSIMAVALHRNFPTSTLCICKKTPPLGRVYFLAGQVIFYHWLMKGLYPTYKQNSQDLKRIGKKTGVF